MKNSSHSTSLTRAIQTAVFTPSHCARAETAMMMTVSTPTARGTHAARPSCSSLMGGSSEGMGDATVCRPVRPKVSVLTARENNARRRT